MEEQMRGDLKNPEMRLWRSPLKKNRSILDFIKSQIATPTDEEMAVERAEGQDAIKRAANLKAVEKEAENRRLAPEREKKSKEDEEFSRRFFSNPDQSAGYSGRNVNEINPGDMTPEEKAEYENQRRLAKERYK